MATALINSFDAFNIETFPNPQLLRPKNAPAIGPDKGFQTEVGVLQFKSLVFADIHIMNLHWQVDRDVSICESAGADTVNINFQVSGRMNTRFAGIADELAMRPQKHNLIYSPQGGFLNTVSSGERVEMFHISLGKQYFSDLIGCEDSWSEGVQKNLLTGRSFVGNQQNMEVTPYMQRLIGEIKQCGQQGAMRNLLIQSKVFELLALQIGQMQVGLAAKPALNCNEVERLYQLKAFIDVHFLQQFSLTDFSRISLLNEFKLKKGFKELFGKTVFEYVRGLRMDLAKRMLLDSSKTIEEVSDMLGYEYPQHFSTAFKRHYGTSPSRLRL